VVVEFTNSQALRGTQNMRKVDWVMMVAVAIAMVAFSPFVTNLETLKLFIAALYENYKG
jgi:divalent metal cation (Fe/Co/Zn/Cd) transporter